MTHNPRDCLGSTSLSLAASLAVRNTNNVWVSDNLVNSCHLCKKRFGLLLRKHHCRCCGNIFCYDCSNYFIAIPDFLGERPEPADRWNVSHYLTPLQSIEERVCRECHTDIRRKIVSRDRIIQMLENPPNLQTVRSLEAGELKTHYYDTLRNIQYFLPNHRYTTVEKKILHINAELFSKHSKYLVHLINSMEWRSEESTRERSDETIANLQLIGSVINGSKTESCCHLFCTRTCQETLSLDDCMTVLYRHGTVLPQEMTTYLFRLVQSSPDVVILCHITFLVNLVRDASTPHLRQSLYDLLTRSTLLTYATYWHLCSTLVAEGTSQSANIRRFVEMMPIDLVKKLGREYSFFQGLIENLDRADDYLSRWNFEESPITLPYRPSSRIVGYDRTSIVFHESYTRPVIIRFYFEEGEHSYHARILFKKESIMNDVAVLSLMTLTEIILKEQVDENISAVTYQVMPIGYCSGMVQIVESAETVQHIIEKRGTILKHIVAKNENASVKDALDRYLYSLVSYTLHNYFIGLGDRHLENIMVTNDGSIFHIDFGFILGTDAYPLTSTDIKLNSNMIDVIANDDTDRQSRYLDLCAHGALYARKFFNMFFIILSQSRSIAEKNIEKFIMSRFQPRQPDEAIIAELMSVIEKSHDAYSQTVRDFLHTHSQRGTVTKGLAAIIGSAVSAVRSITG